MPRRVRKGETCFVALVGSGQVRLGLLDKFVVRSLESEFDEFIVCSWRT